MKKTISILIAFVLCLSFSTIALAVTDITSTEPSTTAAPTTAATTAPETTIPATTVATTASDTTAAPIETTADTTAPDALTDTTVSEADTTMDPLIYYNAAPDDLKRDILTIPQTGTSAGGIAVFAVLSIAAAGFIFTKKKN